MFVLINLSRVKLLINGVYIITCSVNKKFYIGSCAAKDFLYVRLVHHLTSLRANKHHNKYLQNAFNKYGEDKFHVGILEVCSPEKCVEKEQYWIDLLSPHYNFCKKAGSTLGRKCLEETKRKISESNKKWFDEHPEAKLIVSKRRKGIPLPEDHKRKLLEASKNYVLTKEDREKISKALKGKKFSEQHKINLRYPKYSLRKKVINIETGEIYPSTIEASKLLGITTGYISNICTGKCNSEKYKLQYE